MGREVMPTEMEMNVAKALLEVAFANEVDLSAMEAHVMARAAMREPTKEMALA